MVTDPVGYIGMVLTHRCLKVQNSFNLKNANVLRFYVNQILVFEYQCAHKVNPEEQNCTAELIIEKMAELLVSPSAFS